MRQLYFCLFIFLAFTSCSTTSKDYLSRPDDDKTLFDAVKALSKNPTDSNAAKALPLLYDRAQARHMQKIEGAQRSNELTRWDQLIDEYSILQKMHDAIAESDAATRLADPKNYQSTIYDLTQQAAEDYYNEANANMDKPGREAAKTAYAFFKKADKLVPGFKDAKAKMNEAYQNAIVNVVINEIRKNTYNIYTGWGVYNVDYNNQQFQQQLVRELGQQNSSRNAARYFSDWTAGKNNISPDLFVDLTLRQLDIPYPHTSSYSRRSSQQIEVGKDTSGHAIYETVSATITVSSQSFTARAEMELNIKDAISQKTIVYNTYREDYSWQEDHANYTGDSRALSSDDWRMINSRMSNEPRIDDVINELYRRLYPQIRSRISQAVEW